MGGDEDGVSEQGDCGTNEKDDGDGESDQGGCGANEKDDGDVTMNKMTVVPIKR